GRAEPGEVLGLDLAADPPVRVVMRAEVLEGLPRTGEIIEIAAADRHLDRALDELVLVLGGQLHRGGLLLGIRLAVLPRPISGRRVTWIAHAAPPLAGASSLRRRHTLGSKA